ncbi:MAG: preQ(1) synthase [Candidatus Marinimicrobia bacterium]|nr:preQ(1) synthase [Candidatus Neomarinimicrobiota bacterium]
MSDKKLYDKIDSSILKSLPNPEKVKPYEVKIKQPEITFLGTYNQPDFATLYILMYPEGKVVELKSLKLYLQQFRDIVISYERLLNVVYDDLMEKYNPNRLRLVLDCNPRGGISSRLTIDSDWEILGGEEKYKNWREDTW